MYEHRPTERRPAMQKALRSSTIVHGELLMTTPDRTGQREDDLGFAAALRLAIPAALAIWGALIFAVVHFFA